MRRIALSTGLLFLALGFAAAAQVSPHEEMLKQAVDSFEKIGVTLKKIDDKASADAARPELRKLAASFLEARAKAEKMQQPEKEEKVRLERLYKPKLDEAIKLVRTQALRVDNIPGGKEALKEIAGVLKKDSK